MKLRILGERTAWVILAAALLLSLTASGLLVRGDVRELATAHRSLADNLSRQLGRASHLALLAKDRAELRQIARSVLQTDAIIGHVAIYDTGQNRLARSRRDTAQPDAIQRRAAQIASTIASVDLPREYSTRIPPSGEGTTLDPFGTPRADIGRAVLTLSSAQWTRELSNALFRAAQLGLFVFAGLLVTTIVLAWTVQRPLGRLANRLRELTGTDTPAPQADLEGSLEAIGERLTRSEDRARQASEALRNREADLDRARRHAHDAARLRADMIAGMSHELRTPLTAILGHTDMLARTRLNGEQREQVDTVHKSARHLLGLIDDVLEWSGLESGRTTLDEVGFNIVDTIEDTVTLLAPMAYEKNLELVHFVYQDVPARLRGDPLRFQQILTNLVSNAIKFTDTGSVVVRAMLEEESDDSVYLRVSVADTGPGITAEDRPRLFTLYERLNNESAQSGSGMGLAISKRLLELMGGSIDVDSTPGFGSEFYFTLPLRKTLHDEADARTGPDLAGCCLWLVEAFAPARKTLKHQIEAWQATVVEMDDRAALNTALSDPNTHFSEPDALILGLRATEANAADVLALLGDDSLPPPVITLVSASDNRIHENLEQAGAARSMPKSVNRMRLYRELCETIGIVQNNASTVSALEGMQVLVAEDSPASQRYLAAQLTELGASVAVAGDGEETIAAWQKGTFPLVFADDRMPGADGPAVFERIRSMAAESTQPVLVGITADADGNACRRFLDAGADDCLIKPFDANRIAQQIAPLTQPVPGSAPTGSAPDADLTTDPEMANLLAQELPRQLADVETAIAARDYAQARESVHTLHGTAAFYRLDTLKAAAGTLENVLADDQSPGDDDMTALRHAARQAQEALEQRTCED